MTTSRASRARKLTLVLLIGLMVFMAAETFLFAPPTMSLAAILFIIGIKIVPPALFILPLSRGQAMSAVWLGILLMPYFCWAVLGALVPGTEGVVAAMRGVLTAACVVSAMLFARWQKAASAA